MKIKKNIIVFAVMVATNVFLLPICNNLIKVEALGNYNIKVDSQQRPPKTCVLVSNKTIETGIKLDTNNLLVKSNVKPDELRKVLEGTGLENLTDVYIAIEKEYGINAIIFASLSAHESAWGTSRRAIEDNNLTGFGVEEASSEGINAETKEENLFRTAKWLKDEYLSEEGLYYNGLSLKSVNKSFCLKNKLNSKGRPIKEKGKFVKVPDYEWSDSIKDIAEDLYNKIKENKKR